jgi:tetratricopeptide (TPR) repeat protein
MDAESLACLVQAARLDPSNPRWTYLQGGIYQNRSERATALACYERAVELTDRDDETNTTPRLMFAEMLAALGRPDDAQAQYELVRSRQPNNPRAHFGLGMLAVRRSQWEAAETHLLQAAASPHAQKKATIQLAAVRLQRGDPEGAETYRRKVDQLSDDTPWPDPYITEYLQYAEKKKNRYRRAQELESAGRFAEAAEVLRPLAERFPDDYLVRVTLGKVLAQMGEYPEAEEHLRRAVAVAPEKVQTHYYLALLLFREGEQLWNQGEGERAAARQRFEEAAEQSRLALAVKPDYGFAHMCLGLSLKYLGKRDEALAALEKSVACNPEFGELQAHVGMMLADMGRGDEARPHLERALHLGGVNRPAVLAALQKVQQADPAKAKK